MAFTAEGGVQPKGERYDRSYLVKSDDKLYKKTEFNDFIYSSNNLDVGSIGLNKYGTAVISDVYEIFRIKPDNSPTFMSELIQRPHNIAEILKYRQGCLYGQYRIYAEDFLNVSVLVPTKPEQEKVSQFLDALDHRIKHQTSLIKALKKYKRGLLNKIFSKTDGKTYPTVYLSEVADFLQGLTYSPSDVSNSGHLVLRSSNIQNGVLSFDDCVYVDKSIPECLQVKCADVLMCVRNGSKSLVGKTALIPNDMPMTTWGAFMMIVRSKLNDTYIFHYLNSQMFFSQVFKDTGTATINQITKGILNECKLPLPPAEERRNISKMLSSFDAKIQNAERKLTTLMEVKKALLQQLFI